MRKRISELVAARIQRSSEQVIFALLCAVTCAIPISTFAQQPPQQGRK